MTTFNASGEGIASSANLLYFYTQGAVTLTLYVHSGSASGPLISGALVSGWDGAGNSFSQTTGVGGYVTITGTPGTWQFTASGSGYTANSWSQSITTTETLNAYMTPTVVPVTLTLYVHSGNASGPLISGALVSGWDGAGNSFSQTTGVGGYVTITGTPGTWQFTASGSGYTANSWSQSITTTETLNAYMTPTVVPVTLTLYVHSGNASGPLIWGALVTGSDGAGNSFSQTTGAGGYVTITGTPGTWQFTASGSGYTANSWSQSITTTETLNAYMMPTVVPVTLTLYVHSGNASGPLISGALVTGSDGAGSSFSQTTGVGGYVTITGTPGTWQFTASGSGYTANTWSQSITTTETLNAYMTPTVVPVTLTLYVHSGNASGPLISGALVRGSDGAGSSFSQTTGVGGYVTITGTAGTWQFTASGSGYTANSWSQSITTTETLNAYMTPTVTPPVTLTLYIHNGSASGPVISGAQVTGHDAAGNSFSQTTGAAGYVTITGTPGTWSFTASALGYSANSWNQSITTTVTLNAYVTPNVTPQVAAPTFSPSPGTYSSAQSVTISTTTSGATIRYTLTGIDPTSSSALYSGPVAITSTKTLKARAFKSGMTDSTVTSGTYTISIQQVASPSFRPMGGIYTSAQNVTITSATSGATIRYTVNGVDPTSSSTLYSGPVPISSTTTLKAKAFKSGMADSGVAIGTYTIAGTSVVLLLHGMNSDPSTWNDFINDNNYFPSYIPGVNVNVPTAPIIFGGSVLSASGTNPTLDNKGVRYYRVQFGAYDQQHGRTGLENLVATGSGDDGDFTSFSGQYSHAKEIRDAIAYILSQFPNAKILLVGHSRGGIDARAFLQDTSYTTERNAVVGLLTVGTPHQGSPLGRIYGFLNTHTRSSWKTTDWTLVDELRGAANAGLIPYPKKLDVRRPTIDDLAISSLPLTQLAQGVASLPTSAKYGTLQFNGARLGLLADKGWFGQVDIFTGGSAYIFSFDALTSTASNAICKYSPRSNFVGDGIVPYASQTFSGRGITVTQFYSTGGVILHTGEPADKTDIRLHMKSLVNWWN